MAVLTGLEPAASGVTGRRYNQLNYSTMLGFIYRPRSFTNHLHLSTNGSLSSLFPKWHVPRIPQQILGL